MHSHDSSKPTYSLSVDKEWFKFTEFANPVNESWQCTIIGDIFIYLQSRLALNSNGVYPGLTPSCYPINNNTELLTSITSYQFIIWY